jgi:lipopolysaccharide transport system ATP-binding protein
MAAPAVRVTHLRKRYRLGQAGEGFDTLRDAIAGVAGRMVRKLRASQAAESRRTLWALDDVSFDVAPGEVVGVIGGNGAGKTTLLKLLSRITEPTAGRIELNGRVGSLLEVGTGFHPELTGRENVFLNGAILGMRRTEIAGKFDEIVAFADVERFLDTPVKHYSSGMYVRLAFSVAAHLEPEILLVDEVLAVGDAAFQRKCLGKMQEVSRGGRTVVFVSHSMPTVVRLCERAILLTNGRVAADGPPADVVACYLRSGLGTTAHRIWAPDDAPGTAWLKLRGIRVVDEDRETAETFDMRDAVGIEIAFDVLGDGPPFIPMVVVNDDAGTHVFNAMDTDAIWRRPAEKGRHDVTAWIPGDLLNEGTLMVSVLLASLASGKSVKHAVASDAVAFSVVDLGKGGTAKGDLVGRWGGAVCPLLRWTKQRV